MYLYTDGGCHNNPGPGAWAYRLIAADDVVITEMSGFLEETTNNQMELLAVIHGIQYLRKHYSHTSVTILTDSEYVKNGITVWIKKWIGNGWKTANKKPVKNVQLWKTLHSLIRDIHVQWQWIKGHSGNKHNEACDMLVQKTIHTKK